MAKARRLKPPEIEEIFRRFHDIEPEPKGELNSVNEFTFLVAVVLSAQATDMGVNRATSALFKAVDTPEKMRVCAITSSLSASTAPRPGTSLPSQKFWWKSMAAKSPANAKLWRLFPAWGARQPMWF